VQPGVAYALNERDAILSREHPIHNEQVIRGRQGAHFTLYAVMGNVYRIAFFFKTYLEATSKVFLVFNEQQVHRNETDQVGQREERSSVIGTLARALKY
jgi:hypothetical protein